MLTPRHRALAAIAVLAAGAVTTLPDTAAGPLPAAAAATPTATADPYTWRNVQIGGGGFVPGIIFNQTQPNLIYARTDIGGAYRWNQSTGRWIPLLDWVSWDRWGWTGVASLATDPVDTGRVYAGQVFGG